MAILSPSPPATHRDVGVFIDVKEAFAPHRAPGAGVDGVLDRIRREHPDFVVLNFHEINAVPDACRRLVDSILADTSNLRIVLTETSVEVRRELVDDGLLRPAVLTEPEHEATTITRLR